jgi:hypothetical protein
MIDGFLFLAPILCLAVVALFAFVGCQFVYGVTPKLDPPANLTAVAGNGEITLSWDPSSGADSYTVQRGTTDGGPYDTSFTVPGTQTNYLDTPLTNGTTYYYVVIALADGEQNSDPSNQASATPMAITPVMTPFVVNATPGTPKQDFTGFAGMAIKVGPNSLTVYALGRMFAQGNANSHTVKIVDATNGQDVMGGSVSVNMAGGTLNAFVYAPLAAPITLDAGADLYLVSSEIAGGDFFYDNDTTVQTTTAASVTSAVYTDATTPFTPTASAGHTYGPVDFKYS